MKKRIISLLLALVACFPFFTGCTEEEQLNISTFTPHIIEKTDAVHIYNMTETEDYLVREGVTDYVLLLPAGASDEIGVARDEFKTLFAQATDINILVMIESGEGVPYSPDAKYISLGYTEFAKQALATLNREEFLPTTRDYWDSVRIETIGKSIFLAGGGPNDMGVVFSVYTFMEMMFNFDMYYHNTWDLDEGVTNVKLCNYDVTDIPDIPQRGRSFGYVEYNYGGNNVKYRFRQPYGSYGAFLYPTYELDGAQGRSATLHNTDELVNHNSKLYDGNMVSDNGNQLCYTAHGNPESYENMVTIIVGKFVDVLKKYYGTESWTTKNTFTITIEDNSANCSCLHCREAKALYGADAGACIKLCNAVMDALVGTGDGTAWMEQPENAMYKRDDLVCLFFAYSGYVTPPTHWDEAAGKYVMNHSDLEMRHDVGTFWCQSSREWNKALDIYDEKNSDALESYLAWADVSSVMWIWGYQTNFYGYQEFNPSWQVWDDKLYEVMGSTNVVFFFNQSQGANEDVTTFHALKGYLEYKLTWNCTLDSDELIDKWFNAMYREAAGIMREYFEFMNDYWLTRFAEENILSGTSQSLNFQQYHPVARLTKEMEYCDKAIDLIKSLYEESNPELCERLVFNIELEWIAPAYHLVNLYNNIYVSQDVLDATIARFKELGTKLGSMGTGEGANGGINTWIEGL